MAFRETHPDGQSDRRSDAMASIIVRRPVHSFFIDLTPCFPALQKRFSPDGHTHRLSRQGECA